MAGLVVYAIRPNLNTSLSISGMTIEELRRGGGSSLFSTLRPCTRIGTTLTCAPGNRFGNLGRKVLRADEIVNVGLSVSKSPRLFAWRPHLHLLPYSSYLPSPLTSTTTTTRPTTPSPVSR